MKTNMIPHLISRATILVNKKMSEGEYIWTKSKKDTSEGTKNSNKVERKSQHTHGWIDCMEGKSMK